MKFRQWATKVLKEYLLRGYAFSQRLSQLEDKIDRRLAKHDQEIVELKDKVDFFVQASLPPMQGVFYNDRRKWHVEAAGVSAKEVMPPRASCDVRNCLCAVSGLPAGNTVTRDA